jgi:hypothetical protein
MHSIAIYFIENEKSKINSASIATIYSNAPQPYLSIAIDGIRIIKSITRQSKTTIPPTHHLRSHILHNMVRLQASRASKNKKGN